MFATNPFTKTAHLVKQCIGFVRRIAFVLPPQHQYVNKRLGLLTGNVAQRRYNLVKGSIDSGTTYGLNLRLGI